MRLIVSTIFIFLFLGCGVNNKAGVSHPTPENLPSENDKNTNIIDIKKTPEQNISQAEELQGIENIELVSQIGQIYGEPNETFGNIGDIKIDSKNRVYILDIEQQHIQVYEANGDYITKLGNKGEGPGEFRLARSMDIYKDSLLYVSNGHRIEVFDVSQNEITFIESKTIDKSIRSLCIADDKLFLNPTLLTKPEEVISELGYKNMIYAYSLDTFEQLFLFGKSYISSNPFLLDSLSIGTLTCNKSTSSVTFSFEYVQVIQGYSAKDGTLEWQTRLDGLRMANVSQFIENGIVGLEYSQPDRYFDLLLHPIYYSGRYNLVQIERNYLDEEGFKTNDEVITFMLDSVNGKISKLDVNLPIILHASHNLMATINEERVMSKIYSLN